MAYCNGRPKLAEGRLLGFVYKRLLSGNLTHK